MMPYSSDAADDETAKKIDADDEKQHASLIASALAVQWNFQRTHLVQVKSFSSKTSLFSI